jgi:hypothetical protein
MRDAVSGFTEKSESQADNRNRQRLVAELRFPNDSIPIRGELYRSHQGPHVLTLRSSVQEPIYLLPGSIAVLHVATSECRYAAEVQVQLETPHILQLRLLGLHSPLQRDAPIRTKISCDVLYRTLSTSGRPKVWRAGVASDLSDKGIGLIVPHALLPGQTIETGIKLTPAQRQQALLNGLDLRNDILPVPAHVVYCQAMQDSRWRIGAQFTGLTPGEKLTLKGLVETLKSKP